MEISPQRNSQSAPPSRQLSGEPIGALPAEASRHSSSSYAVITRDRGLQVGEFTLSLDTMIRNIGTLAKLCKRIPDTFPNEVALYKVLPSQSIPILPASLPFSEAYEGFKRAMSGAVRDIDFVRCKGKLENLSRECGLSREELLEVRALLMEGARLATICAGIDEALGRDAIVDRGGPTNLFNQRIKSILQAMPFEDFNTRSLRIELDLMAQRMELREDGSPAVREVVNVERAAAELLQRGVLSRTITLSRGGIGAHLLVSSEQERLFSETFRLEDVFSALRLGQSASLLISSLTSQNVDLVRLCGFVDRSSAIGVQVCLELLPPQTHVRLSYIDEWALGFETRPGKILSDDERHDLAALLLDAEISLFIAEHLKAVCGGGENARFWRSLGRVAIKDRDVRAARELVNNAPDLFACDCSGAQSVVSNAAMMLGFNGEDRCGAGWRVPENNVVSLAWALARSY